MTGSTRPTVSRGATEPAFAADTARTQAELAEPSPSMHVPALDGMRGIAVLLVVAHHCGFLAFGWAGVDIFFVLSGFLITQILRDSRDEPHYFRNFFARRALRIFPLYYLFVAAMLLNHALSDGDTEGSTSMLLFLTNRRMALNDGYQSIPNRMGILWSMGVEEQFYLVWPFVVRYVPVHLVARICVIGAVAVLLLRFALILPVWEATPAATARYVAVHVSTITRLDALLIGAWLALQARSPRLPRTLLPVLLALLAGVTWLGRGKDHEPWMQTVGFSLLALLALVCVVQVLRGGVLARVCRAPVLRAVGSRSYSMYLFHQTAIGLVIAVGVTRPVIVTLLVVLLSYGIAEITWRTIESPMLALKSHFPRHAPSAAVPVPLPTPTGET